MLNEPQKLNVTECLDEAIEHIEGAMAEGDVYAVDMLAVDVTELQRALVLIKVAKQLVEQRHQFDDAWALITGAKNGEKED